jgi:hypothetical protein
VDIHLVFRFDVAYIPQFGPEARRMAIKGGDFIRNGIPFDAPVIPAKAGIQSFVSASPTVCERGFPLSRE